MKVVITGPTGAVGMALIHKCVEQGDEVLAICHKNSKRSTRLQNIRGVRVLEMNLSEYENAFPKDLPKEDGYQVFYHLAWEGTTGGARNDTELQMRNVSYTLAAVKMAKRLGCHTFIGAGSQAEYGRVEGSLSEKTPVFPENGYGIAKLCAGQMSRLLCKQLGMKQIWTRIVSVYGPYDGEQSMISSAIRHMILGEDAPFTSGGQLWDYLYSKDAAEAFYLLATKGVDGAVYVLGSGETRPLREYIEVIAKQVREEKPKQEFQLLFGAIPYAHNQVMRLCADLTRLKEDTGFSPKTEFEEGIRQTIQQFVKGM